MQMRVERVESVDWGDLDKSFPTAAVGFGLHEGRSLRLPSVGTHYGVVLEGGAEIETHLGRFPLLAGMYFAAPFEVAIHGGRGLVMTRMSEHGLFTMGGPLEHHGRLRAKHGGTDTLLLAPTCWGDACLNLSVLPPETREPMHSHASVRVGVVVSGRGFCVSEAQSLQLEAGMAFCVPPGMSHGLQTEGQGLHFVTYQPNSSFGPTDDVHRKGRIRLRAGHPSARLRTRHRADGGFAGR